MKKNRKYGPVISSCRLKKLIMVTKLTFLMTVCLVYGLSARVLSQQKVTMDLGYATVKEVLTEFQRQTGQIVIYSSEKLDTRQKVKASFTNESVENFLSAILSASGMSYKIMEDYILIVPKNKEEISSQVQKTVIQGSVIDENGRSLPGVSVVIKGTTIGVATDIDGNFSITVPEMKELILCFTFIGMEKREVVYEGQEKLKVVLKESASEMDEVVVTGYQEIKKTRMTGAVEVVTAKDIVNKGFTSVEDVLKGTLAGVTTMSITGRPGAQSQIRIRGINSLTGNTDPIWIIDGMPLQGDLPEVGVGAADLQNTVLTSGIGNLSPDDIESITILKDAAATAIYGSRAANGVIVVKTKRGIAGQSYVNVQVSYSFDEAPKSKLEMMNSREKIAFETGLYADFPEVSIDGRAFSLLKDADMGKIDRDQANAELERLGNINTNWYDEIFKLAHTQNYMVSLSGGSEKTQYYASLNYMDQEGVMPNNRYDKFGASLKLTHDFNQRLRVYADLYANIRDDRTTASIVDPLEYATFANPYERPYDENGNYAYDRSYYADLSKVKDGYMYDFNVLKDLTENTSKTHYLSNQVNLKLEYKILDELLFSTQGTFANTSSHTQTVLNPGSFSSKYKSWIKSIYPEKEITDDLNNGSLQEKTSRNRAYTWRNQLEYARNFQDKHFISAVAGHEMSDSKSHSFGYLSPEYDPLYGIIGFPDLSGVLATKVSLSSLLSTSEEQDRSVSFFLTGSYSYMDRYVISGSYRWDGVDIIGKDNRFTPLWNISFKYNLHNEEFMKGVGWINALSLRGSFGYTGSIDHDAYPFTILKYGSTSYRYDGEKIPTQITPGNPSIKWQRKEDRSIGIDFSLWNNRINGTVNYYNNDTRDLLDKKQTPVSSGRVEVKANVATLNNQGWEVSLNTLNINYKSFRWSTSFNIAVNKNRVLDTYYQNVADLPSIARSNSSQQYFVKDQPVEAWYGYDFAGVDPATGHTLAYIDAKDAQGNPIGHLTENGRYVIDMDTEYTTEAVAYLGEGYPPVSGGFGTQFSLGRFSLSAQFSFMAGHKIKSFESAYGVQLSAAKYNQLSRETWRWRKIGDITGIPGYTNAKNASSQYFFSSQVEKGDYLKCNNISLGYNMSPEWCQKLRLTRMRLNMNIQNVFTSTKYRGLDPENMGAFGYPGARSYVISLNIGI